MKGALTLYNPFGPHLHCRDISHQTVIKWWHPLLSCCSHPIISTDFQIFCIYMYISISLEWALTSFLQKVSLGCMMVALALSSQLYRSKAAVPAPVALWCHLSVWRKAVLLSQVSFCLSFCCTQPMLDSSTIYSVLSREQQRLLSWEDKANWHRKTHIAMKYQMIIESPSLCLKTLHQFIHLFQWQSPSEEPQVH